MKTISDKDGISIAQRRLVQIFEDSATAQIATRISHPAGVSKATVFWIEKHGIWAHFGFPPLGKSPGKRYWNVYGLGKPAAYVGIVCEINPPVEGINRQAAGVFAEHGDEVHVFHRGNLNAFRGRIPRDFLKRNLCGVWLPVDDGGREVEMLHIGVLAGAEIVSSIAAFARETQRIKKLYKGELDGPTP